LGEGPIGRRLGFENVERRGADDARFDRAPQRRFVHQFAARGVDEPDACLASCEPLLVEEMLGFRRRWEMQRQVVGARTHIVERHQFDT
jgi:hypothetical protein